MSTILHGGTDSGPAVLHDFSTNANPLPPPGSLVEALQAADRRRYPDPQYRRLREHLAAAHGVEPAQVLPTAGGAEAIRRISLAALLLGLREVWVLEPGFGDYAAAALALGLTLRRYAKVAELLDAPKSEALVWICEPCNPTGASLGSEALEAISAGAALTVVDRAYEPLRLSGAGPLIPSRCWQLHCPNKALGHTGVRAAYLLAPSDASPLHQKLSQKLNDLASSWVLSTEGQVLLLQWQRPEIQAWLAESREQLRSWGQQQRQMLADLGWQQEDSCTPFWLASPPQALPDLRGHGIKLRDASSFGLPGWMRIATLPPSSQLALQKVIQA
ncbi:aminotransferase class I/II-fold pyridoxal phosphate-dependent enzyme [Paucibacter sp. Y2R2-4]|uniref:aminotransferase class I/II-fold pyridoxal phosphate-dependent enzyme n=1 Tax=Paucibacter sp. Y2R2-4 TaxID=2893553 RepID=UPI0021E46E15|nr:aminotransferase class I/II-fold pyridoxal phosphate-dependent enzyme [Paucibacter sp. Y2R2-4]MCV2349907.1 aminotransferase class I/II-fold pyridoxal phosphate-dependent enzyme [Paucibacter sp. Y2R2-4]